MKNVVLARVDDRLIHGEVVSVWTPSLNVNRIIVVDDEVAADKFNYNRMADMGLAGVLGTAYAIIGGLDTDTVLALAVPIGILGTIVWAGRMTFDCFFVHMADKYIEEEKKHYLLDAMM